MDVLGTKWSSNVGAEPKNSLHPQSASNQVKASNKYVAITSLASKLSEAQASIDSAKLNQQPLSWDKNNKVSLNVKNNRDEIASAKLALEHLSKSQLETVSLEPSGIFSDAEKVAAYERWHALDQADLSGFRRSSLQNESATSAMASFEQALLSHIDSFSSLGQAMISEQYQSQVTSQFESAVNELSLAKGESQSEHYYGVMVEDIFGGNEPEVLSGADGMSLSNLSRNDYDFLTQEDRELLADIYQYADQNDIDFKYIRRFASDLSDYRRHDDGKMLGNFNNGHFDAQGHQLTISFTEQDQATIDNILSSEGLSSTAIDRGFISFITEPGQGALSHIGSYSFLQHMVEVTAGMETSVSADEFKQFKGFSGVDERYVITASEETLPMPEPDVVCTNGVCEVTEKGRNNGVTLERDINTFKSALDLKSESIGSLLQLHENNETKEAIWFKWLVEH